MISSKTLHFSALLVFIGNIVFAYEIPVPVIEALKPRGFRVSISDEPGIQRFAFHGNINKSITINKFGLINGFVSHAENGSWIFEDPEITINPQDVINYWLYAQVNGAAYIKDGGSWTAQKSEQTENECERSETTIQDGVSTCQGELIFEDNFDAINNSIWNREIKIPLDPDYEFCVYHNHEKSATTTNGILKITPSILEDDYGEGAVSFGNFQLARCTSNIPNECSQQASSYNILTPVISARLVTKPRFSFKYGKIEIRAKFPQGDWLYPEMWLQPRYSQYGPGYSSGRIVLGMARGNKHLTMPNDPTKDLSRRLLEFGIRSGTVTNVREETVKKAKASGTWTTNYHVYTTIWSSKGFTFQVDGREVGRLAPNSHNWLENSTRAISSMAPFDQEFYISIGVGAGGARVFPDESISDGNQKPWKNVGAKARLNFWRSRNQWIPTWKEEQSKNIALEIDYIKIWAV